MRLPNISKDFMIYKINKTGLKGSVNFFSVDYRSINPIQNGGGKERGGGGPKKPPSTNARIILQNFLTFSFNPFGRLVQNFKFIPSAAPKFLNLNQDHPSKKGFFLVKSL